MAETFCRHCSQPIVEISHPWGATWFHQPTDELNDPFRYCLAGDGNVAEPGEDSRAA